MVFDRPFCRSAKLCFRRHKYRSDTKISIYPLRSLHDGSNLHSKWCPSCLQKTLLPSHSTPQPSMDQLKMYIETQGCQMNEYDSHRMADLLGDSHGYVLTKIRKEADILLMNTCSIHEKAQEKCSLNWVAGAN